MNEFSAPPALRNFRYDSTFALAPNGKDALPTLRADGGWANDAGVEVARFNIYVLGKYPEIGPKIALAVELHDELVAALRAVLFQVVQGGVLERDACITQARAAFARAGGSA